VRTSLSGACTQPKGGGRIAGPGPKGHRILRRVLGGGRHLRTSRAIGFHESVVTATLAFSQSAGNDRERLIRARATQDRAKAPSTFRARGSRDRGVRGLVDSRRRGKKTPTLFSRIPKRDAGKRQKQAACVSLRSAEAFSSVVKTLGPPVKCRSPRLLHPPRGESRGASRERTKYGCT
jgi:hypothetical protein